MKQVVKKNVVTKKEKKKRKKIQVFGEIDFIRFIFGKWLFSNVIDPLNIDSDYKFEYC